MTAEDQNTRGAVTPRVAAKRSAAGKRPRRLVTDRLHGLSDRKGRLGAPCRATVTWSGGSS